MRAGTRSIRTTVTNYDGAVTIRTVPGTRRTRGAAGTSRIVGGPRAGGRDTVGRCAAPGGEARALAAPARRWPSRAGTACRRPAGIPVGHDGTDAAPARPVPEPPPGAGRVAAPVTAWRPVPAGKPGPAGGPL